MAEIPGYSENNLRLTVSSQINIEDDFGWNGEQQQSNVAMFGARQAPKGIAPQLGTVTRASFTARAEKLVPQPAPLAEISPRKSQGLCFIYIATELRHF